MLYLGTNSVQRTESQCKSRNILLDGAQSKDQLHRGGVALMPVNIKSWIGRQKISLLYKQEDRKNVENYGRAYDIITRMEDCPREDQCQHIK